MDDRERDAIWNRAAMETGGQHPMPGDTALADLLRAHGMIQNGGVDHCLDSLSVDELDAAARGFNYFGLEEASQVLRDATALGEREQNTSESEFDEAFEALDERYHRLFPSDQVLVDRFTDVLRRAPGDFADPAG
jgi:hypothetical protein